MQFLRCFLHPLHVEVTVQRGIGAGHCVVFHSECFPPGGEQMEIWMWCPTRLYTALSLHVSGNRYHRAVVALWVWYQNAVIWGLRVDLLYWPSSGRKREMGRKGPALLGNELQELGLSIEKKLCEKHCLLEGERAQRADPECSWVASGRDLLSPWDKAAAEGREPVQGICKVQSGGGASFNLHFLSEAIAKATCWTGGSEGCIGHMGQENPVIATNCEYHSSPVAD